MPARPDPRSALGRGAAAFDATPEDQADPEPIPTRPTRPTRGRSRQDTAPVTDQPTLSWEERHWRVIFHCPNELVDALEAEMRRSGRSKSRVLTEALREHLQKGQAGE